MFGQAEKINDRTSKALSEYDSTINLSGMMNRNVAIASRIDSKDAVANSTNVIPKSVARILAKSMPKINSKNHLGNLENTNPITNNILVSPSQSVVQS